MRIANDTLIAATTSLAANWTSEAVYLGHIYSFSIQLVFSGTPTGTFKLQGSNDAGQPDNVSPALRQTGVTNWTDIIGSAQAVTANGDHTWNASNIGFAWVRVVWTSGAAQGSLTSARINIKGV